MRAPAVVGVVGAVTLIGAALWSRRHPSACAYGQRLWVEIPHPIVTRRRLHQILEAHPGERLLEVGPGTGYYSLDVATQLGPEGRLDLLDLQQEMLDHTLRRADERGLDNLVPTQGDARELPYPDATFDAALAVTTLGEVPDQAAALAELRRVLRPGGRLVIGELLLGDPHAVRFGALERRAAATGLAFERRLGGPLGYFARFRLSPGAAVHPPG